MYQSVRKYLKFQMLVRPNYFQWQLTYIMPVLTEPTDQTRITLSV